MKLQAAGLLAVFGLAAMGADLPQGVAAPGLATHAVDNVKDMTLKELARELYSNDEARRRAVINQCVKLNTTDSWKLVIEGLANDKGRPADEAQLKLALLEDDKALKMLWGKEGLNSKDVLVRMRVAELLGRREMGVEAEFLAKALGDKEPDVRRLLLWSVERLAQGGHLQGDVQRELFKPLLKMAKKDRDGAVRGAALLAFGAIATPEEAMDLARLIAADRLQAARCGAARFGQALGESDPVGALSLLGNLLSDESSNVRRAAVDGLEAVATKSGVGLMIARLEVEERERVRWALVDSLQRLSGRKYRLDVRPWKLWHEKLADDWKPESSSSDGHEADRGEATVAFAGMPILSDRVCFLIDLSGSIWTKKSDGVLPKDVVGEELQKALDTLPEGTLFNVIPYINDPVPWQDELQKAKSKNVEAAKEFYSDCKSRGAGNVYDAIQLALVDPEVDTIIILTDGAPSGGHRWNLDLMVQLLTEQNRYRAVTYDALLVGASDFLTKRWLDLTKATGGECTSIEL
ncbi:MAG: HEAT repeat domain-containing protein [Planctomycetota bacterium]|nr:HEAT repeat domain-containing protein [Planctomycetota bacterium]MDG2142399.1 HEAT repeat domain-containing protein [Planctomycetota bacterium]